MMMREKMEGVCCAAINIELTNAGVDLDWELVNALARETASDALRAFAEPDDEMVDRIARAIANSDTGNARISLYAVSPHYAELCHKHARAVCQAIAGDRLK